MAAPILVRDRCAIEVPPDIYPTTSKQPGIRFGGCEKIVLQKARREFFASSASPTQAGLEHHPDRKPEVDFILLSRRRRGSTQKERASLQSPRNHQRRRLSPDLHVVRSVVFSRVLEPMRGRILILRRTAANGLLLSE